VGVWVFWPAARSPLSPLEGSLDLLIWNKDDPSRRGLSVRDPQTLPLRANDQIRIQVELNRPAYLYVVDSSGAANSSGYSVTLGGGGGGDTTPPSAPSGLSVS